MQGGPAKVGAYVARVGLSAPLDRVERGEKTVITRHNRSVARLIPEGQGQNVVAAYAAVPVLTRLRAPPPRGRGGWSSDTKLVTTTPTKAGMNIPIYLNVRLLSLYESVSTV
ncbi:MAG: hypothetical protein EXR01_05900 [Acetobacteraceae bacterium]|nr:hypothetical protein [Acetobacteraceae bacterium]